LAISKERKEELIADYIEQLRQSKGFILADYRGLSVSAMEDIRRSVRPIGAETRVVKNRLLALALEEVGMSLPEEWLEGPTLVDFCHDEVPPVAKALTDAAKGLDQFHIKGGLISGSIMTVEQVQAVADLPPLDVLFGQIMGTVNAPASRISGVVASGVRQVLNLLQAYKEKLEEAAPTAGGGVSTAAEAA
jgi:large subunit ribosomal protein L10